MARKILYAVDNFSHLVSYHQPYLREIAAKGIEIHAAACSPNRGCPYVTRFFSFPPESGSVSYESFSAVRFLIPILKNERYDMIVLCGSWVSLLLRTALLFLSPPHPYVVRIGEGLAKEKDDGFFKKTGALLREKTLRCVTDEILALTADDYAYAEHHKLYRDKLLLSAGLGLDLDRFRPATALEKSETRYRLGIPEHVQVLLYAGNFTPRANHEMLIRAARFLPKDVYLYLPGEGIRLEKCRELAESLGVLGQVGFPGAQRSVLPALYASDIAVSAEMRGTLSMPLLSAMACGLPVVAADTKGNRQIVRDGANGYLYPAGNEYQFADRVIRIYSDRELERSLGTPDPEFLAKYDLSFVLPEVTQALLF